MLTKEGTRQLQRRKNELAQTIMDQQLVPIPDADLIAHLGGKVVMIDEMLNAANPLLFNNPKIRKSRRDMKRYVAVLLDLDSSDMEKAKAVLVTAVNKHAAIAKVILDGELLQDDYGSTWTLYELATETII